MATELPNPTIISAWPTKSLFIYMLVRDISLIDAIIDLVDNCIDGARRLRPDGEFQGLWVRLELSKEQFRITDNCGGIPVDIARRYAFRFGRPEDMEATRHSVGQFGVGMKRALFKMGKTIEIQSTTANSRFLVRIDVDEWRKEESDWHFTFAELDEQSRWQDPDQRGTTIDVETLHTAVSAEFERDNFQKRLRLELAAAHQHSTNNGLAVTVNQIPLEHHPAQLLQSDQLKVTFEERVLLEKAPAPVKLKLFAGVSDSNPSKAGWYVFCNGRLVLEADKSSTTGWGGSTGTKVPVYHNQFAQFRGYTFLDCDDAGALPWNTTKTGLDADSAVYQSVKLQMVAAMRPIIDFLNKVKEEADAEEKPLEQIIEEAKPVNIAAITQHMRFVPPAIGTASANPRLGNIQYKKPLEEINRVKDRLKVSSLREVGEKTFDYFYKLEGEE
jgi:hypothetical protein